MFFSTVFAIAKHRKLAFVSLAFLGVTFTFFLASKSDIRQEGIPCTTLEGFGNPVRALAFSPDGKSLATGDGSLTRGTTKLWNVETGTERLRIGEYTNAIPSLVFSPDGRTLAIGCYDGTVSFWDLLLGQDRMVFRNSERCHYMAAFSPDGRILATWGTIGIWLCDLTTGGEQAFGGVTGPVAFVPDDHPLV